MNSKEIEYINNLGLHDAMLNRMEIDFNLTRILFEIVTLTTSFEMIFNGVSAFQFDNSPDFINKETILDHEFSNEHQFRMYTTSCINYNIKFEQLKLRERIPSQNSSEVNKP